MSEPDPAVPQWDVADRMRKSLREASIGVTEIADYLDVSRTSVSNWINGRIPPSVQTLRLWALRTGVPYEWLAGPDFRRRGVISALTYIFATQAKPYALAA